MELILEILLTEFSTLYFTISLSYTEKMFCFTEIKKNFFLIKKKTTQSVLTVMIFFAAIEKLKMLVFQKDILTCTCIDDSECK